MSAATGRARTAGEAAAPKRKRAPAKPAVKRPKRRHSIGVAMTGGNPLQGRHPSDFYPTPREVTRALLERIDIRGPVWEPCCGDGAMAKVLEEAGIPVIGTDLFDRGYGTGGVDLLAAQELRAPDVITNPPFKLAAPIIATLLPLKPRLLCLTLKATFWSAFRRTPLYRMHTPSWVLPLNWRPDFNGAGNPTMELMWVVWEAGHEGPARFDILERPRN